MNLSVNNDSTYFVTGSESTYGVWVHNSCVTVANSKLASNHVKNKVRVPTSQRPAIQGRTNRGDEWYVYKIPAKVGGGTENVVVVKSVGDPRAGHNYVYYEAGTWKRQDGQLVYNQYGVPKIDNVGKVKAIVG